MVAPIFAGQNSTTRDSVKFTIMSRNLHPLEKCPALLRPWYKTVLRPRPRDVIGGKSKRAFYLTTFRSAYKKNRPKILRYDTVVVTEPTSVPVTTTVRCYRHTNNCARLIVRCYCPDIVETDCYRDIITYTYSRVSLIRTWRDRESTLKCI